MSAHRAISSVRVDDSGYLTCRVCGKDDLKAFSSHLRIHGLTVSDYKIQFGGPTVCAETREKFRAQGLDYFLDAYGKAGRNGLTLDCWTREKVVSWLRREAKRLGRPPTVRKRTTQSGQFRRKGSRPSGPTIRLLFGDTATAYIAAGLEPPVAGRRIARFCKHGHKFTPENTYIHPRGYQACRECQRKRGRGEAGRRKYQASKRIVGICGRDGCNEPIVAGPQAALRQVYCSRKCAGLARRTRIEHECERPGCDEIVISTPARSRRFCSHWCRAQVIPPPNAQMGKGRSRLK